ncbi:MAG: D-tyrosyl-tRNA(Tyr) deacylase [Candidatus Sericytochromatia bacterium]|uniref:D-aminoacyl-tRNA deacylase n=1 Tax=Candidatus Tanganyikabacteria bacterium TaxID=2961651 RepID=A0A937X1G4_9BACT|nr:D-tyrosyl-tRNA(Tyr) deacylase [Candidatus Tanganyikabacteria bacterium]
MRVVLQRVLRAEVRVDGRVTGSIERGLVLLLGVLSGDQPEHADFLADKCLDLRIFPKEPGGVGDLSVRDVAGGVLVISQFTLAGDCRKGRRPDFTASAPPAVAEKLYEHFLARIQASGLPTGAGVFGAMMAVDLVNDGPFTLILDR